MSDYTKDLNWALSVVKAAEVLASLNSKDIDYLSKLVWMPEDTYELLQRVAYSSEVSK